MKKFNEFSEALLVTLHPKSDSVGPVEPCGCQQQDMMSAAAEDVLKNLGGDVIQPDDGIGDYGENQADGIGDYAEDAEGVELECTGDGLRVKFNGLEIVLPKNVVEKIKNHVEQDETETPEDEQEESESEEESTEEPEGFEQEEEVEEEEEEVEESYVPSDEKAGREMKKKGSNAKFLGFRKSEPDVKPAKKNCKCKNK